MCSVSTEVFNIVDELLEVDELQLEVDELLDVHVEELVDDVQLVDVDDLLSYPGH